ncbi:hypothetical protein C8R44DRAFT_887868 [Mycena epipterygia]|nr:hypothetical protein C8R44DRAFT_887868 [Mycena epipterygia]
MSSAASSFASHATSFNFTSTPSSGKDAHERQRIHDAERRVPSAAELILHETTYGDDAGNPPSAYGGIVRPRTRSERHFSASAPPFSSHSHSCSSEHGHTSETLDGDTAPDTKSTTQAREGDVDEGPWPAQFHAALRAQSRDAAAAAVFPCATFLQFYSSGHRSSTSGSNNLTACYAYYNSTSTSPSAALGTHKKMWWPLGGTKGWTSDASWVCVLDTSRSLLATALQQVGALPGGVPWVPGPPWPVVLQGLWEELVALEAREGGSGGFPPLLLELANACIAASWLGGGVSSIHGVPLPVNRPEPPTSYTCLRPALPTKVAYCTRCARASHVIVPRRARRAPFGVHRMAIAGKAAGKDVGCGLGPAQRLEGAALPPPFLSLHPTDIGRGTLVDAYPVCGLGVNIATDGMLHQTEVAQLVAREWGALAFVCVIVGPIAREARTRPETQAWGGRPVLLLLGIRLGSDGVNSVYQETIEMLYTSPICRHRRRSPVVVGVQGNGLLYLDPHHSHPVVPLWPYMGEPVPPPTHPVPRHFVRAGSMSPECGHARGQGHMPMTEDELIYTPSRWRSASADPANGVPFSHPCDPCADPAPVRIPLLIRLPACQYTRRAVRGPRPPLFRPLQARSPRPSFSSLFRPRA